MPTRNVVLTDHQAEMIDHLVKEGRYQNASDVLREGLRLIEQRDAEDRAKLQALRAAAQVGIDAVAAGQYLEFKSPEKLEDYLTKRARRVLARRQK